MTEPVRGVARILYSPAGRFRRVLFQAGESKRIGRDERADVRISDPALRGAHFELLFDGTRFHARELGMGSLALDGRPASFGEVQSGGFIVAGHTTMCVFKEANSWALAGSRADADIEERAREVVKLLAPARDAGTLYGVFDSARDPRIVVLLNESIEEHASLYEGERGAVLDDVAPYMVKFASGSGLLEQLISEGWGNAWGLFVVAAEPWKIVRRQLRRFLMVLDDAANEKMYFRFYDPRVMREFHSVATPRQRAELLHGMQRMVMEGEDGAPIVLEPASSAAEETSRDGTS